MVRSREHKMLYWNPTSCVTRPVHILCDPYWPVQTIPTMSCTGMLLKSFTIIWHHSQALWHSPERLLSSRGLTRVPGAAGAAAGGYRGAVAPQCAHRRKIRFRESGIEKFQNDFQVYQNAFQTILSNFEKKVNIFGHPTLKIHST